MTRGAVASSSGRAKQHVVRLLFGPQHRGKGREAHRVLDSSQYSYSELRAAYLRRVQHLHPDRYHPQAHAVVGHHSHHGKKMDREQAKKNFVELQEAWSAYDKHARALKQSGDADASFTMFGVGCSFSDNDRERILRAEITDQACRGWFSAGILKSGLASDRDGETGIGRPPSIERTLEGIDSGQTGVPSLADDDLFVHNPIGANASDEGTTVGSEKSSRTRPSLVVRSMLRN